MPELPEDIILRVENLKKYFPVRAGFFRRVSDHIKAVDDVSFSIPRGRTLGLVGESGSGKTTVGRSILRAIDPTAGRVLFRHNGDVVDIAAMDRSELKGIRKHLQMVFQDPFSSLNPRMPVLDLIAEPLRAHGWPLAKRRERVHELMELVGLDPRLITRYPHAFSGGQRQRIGIARALALNPSLIVADEPVSALDVSVQAQILNLLTRLQEQLGLTYLFIAHDLSVIRYICDRVAVMYHGRIVEVADGDEIFRHPRHPYTRALIAAAPIPDPNADWFALSHDPETVAVDADAAERPKTSAGCAFAPRCPLAVDQCWRESPPLDPLADNRNRLSACFRADEVVPPEELPEE